jgi:hypothetical protein
MKQHLGLFSYVFFILTFSTAFGIPQRSQVQNDLTLVGAPSAETSRFGMNAGVGGMDYDPAEMFADVMKNFREVTAPDGVTPVAKDAKGWPLADCRFLVWHGLTRPAETYHQTTTDLAFPVRQRDKVSRARSVVGLDGIDHPKMELVQRAGTVPHFP